MELITVRSQIRNLADRLKKQWQRSDGSWLRILKPEPDTEKVHAAVAALDAETATREDVTRAMGFANYGWIDDAQCHECGRKVDAAVRLRRGAGLRGSTANVCLDCLRKAIEMIEAG